MHTSINQTSGTDTGRYTFTVRQAPADYYYCRYTTWDLSYNHFILVTTCRQVMNISACRAGGVLADRYRSALWGLVFGH